MDFDLQAEMSRVYDTDETSCFVADGVVNLDCYQQASRRILWILREPWVEFGWEMLRDEGVYNRIGNSPTLHVMAYVTYSLLNGFPRWKDMDYLRDDPPMADVLRGIGYINVKKTLGDTTSSLPNVHEWFKKGETVIRTQILECAPDIVIGCSPHMREIFQWFSSDQPMQDEHVSSVKSPYGMVLVEAPHPSCRMRRELLVDSILTMIEKQTRSDSGLDC